MSVAYVDTSAMVAIAFGEPQGSATSRVLDQHSRLISSNLLESELRSVFAREGVEVEEGLLSGIDWVLPDRPLTPEFRSVLNVGYLRGADLWHMATALYVTEGSAGLTFVTLDDAQRGVAVKLGLSV